MTNTQEVAEDIGPDILICEWCGGEFSRGDTKRGPVPRYCRPSHRQRAYEARHAGVPEEGTAEWRVWQAAVDLAVIAPERPTGQSTLIPVATVVRLRDALEASGVDWEALKAERA